MKTQNKYYYCKIGESYSKKEAEDIKKCERVVKAASQILPHDIFTQVGNEVLGPLITGYVIWLRHLIESEKIDQLFFLAREGEAFKYVYEELFGTGRDYLEEYLYISRVSMIRACVKLTTTSTQFMLLMSGLLNHIEDVDGVCDLLGITPEGKGLIERDFGINLNTKLRSQDDYDTLYEALLVAGDDVFTKAYNNTIRYFEQKGIEKGKRIMLADIGWSGTMQYLLNLLFPEVEFMGAYIAVNDFHTEQEYQELSRHGYICNSSDWKFKGQEIRFTTLALESLLQNGDGTTLGYEEYKGEIRAITQERRDQKTIDAVVNGLRQGYIMFAKEYKKYSTFGILEEIQPRSAMAGYRHFAVFPKLSTVAFFTKYKNLTDNIDAMITANHKIGYYLLHPLRFYQEFDLTNAKVVWLKSVFKIPFPYYNFLFFLNRNINMKSKRQKFNERMKNWKSS